MMLDQLHWCFLVAILLFNSLKSGKANPDAEKDITVPSYWHRTLVYHNDNTESVPRTYTQETGIRHRKSTTRTQVATHSVGLKAKGGISVGDKFEILSLQLSYTFKYENINSFMSEEEVYNSQRIVTKVTIPPRSTLTRWELITDVAGTEIINGKYYIDIVNNTQRTPEIYTSLAKVRVRRRINYGHTRIRIKHLDRSEYMTVIRSSYYWPAATLGQSIRYLFILCEDSRGIRIKTLNTTHPGYVWAYSSINGYVYFDWHQQIGYAYDKNVDKQHWLMSKEEPHYDGDVVTFKNKYYEDGALCYDGYYSPSVHCVNGREHKWVLETANVGDSLIDYCKW